MWSSIGVIGMNEIIITKMQTKLELNTDTMKTLRSIKYSLLGGIIILFVLASCDSNPDVTPREDLLPQQFRVDIPSSISNGDFAGGRVRPNGRVLQDDDSIRGEEIYELLAFFIELGDGAGEIVEAIIEGIRIHNIDRVITLTFISDDDGREKNLVVEDNVDFEGQTWDYLLTITDAESEGDPIGGKAMQVFWNDGSPAQGIAIIHLFNMDRAENPMPVMPSSGLITVKPVNLVMKRIWRCKFQDCHYPVRFSILLQSTT